MNAGYCVGLHVIFALRLRSRMRWAKNAGLQVGLETAYVFVRNLLGSNHYVS